MTRQQSDGELHVEAMRLMIEAHERREDPPDWTVWRHMLGLLATIFRGIEDQRRDDQDELMHTRKHCDHWKQARQEAIEAGELMQAEIKVLRQQLDESQARRVVIADEAANDKLQKIAIHCELQAAQDEVKALRQQLAEVQQQDVDAMRAEVERLRTFVGKVRAARDCYEWPKSWHRIEAALAELDAQPAPVAETAEGGT